MSTQPQQAGQFCWNELFTPDCKKAQDFYCALLGWSTQNYPMGETTYTMFSLGDKPVAGMMQCPESDAKTIPPHWGSYISVDDLEATLQKAQSLGATIVRQATLVESFGHFGVVKDPTGAYISLWQSLKTAA